MANTITLSNGENVTLFSDRDIIDVIERFCGYDFAKYVGSLLEDRTHIVETLDRITSDDFDKIDKCNTKRNDINDDTQDHYDKAMESLKAIQAAKDKVEISQSVDRVITEVEELKGIIDKLYDVGGDIYQYAEDQYSNMCDLI